MYKQKQNSSLLVFYRKFLVVIISILFLGFHSPIACAEQTDISGPTGSEAFGTSVAVLPNGNFVVCDPQYSIPSGASHVGAVYLYSSSGTLISTLTGSTAEDKICSGGVTVLSNGNFVIQSYFWDNGGAVDASAVTWGSKTTGVSGVVSASNSLVGSTTNDAVGTFLTSLTNGNYVVSSYHWTNGGAGEAGAVTWGDGTVGVSGVVSASNSLIGSVAFDQVGRFSVTALTNGNYVVISPYWNNGGATTAGAVTFGNGTTGTTGAVSTSNSLIGSTASDLVGFDGVTALSNGNYVVRSHAWDNGSSADVGAVTWGNGTTGISGIVSSSNSLIGSAASEALGIQNVVALTNGNYVVADLSWDNGSAADAGAVIFGNGTAGITGVVSTSNSLYGSTAFDQIGWTVTALANGNYVVRSPEWDNGSVGNVGAATFGYGVTGTTGAVSGSNSLIGSTSGDRVSDSGITALANGNYVVGSPDWDNGTTSDVGASTFGNGTTGITGAVSTANSLIGSTAGDNVTFPGGVFALANGNYVVCSPSWNNGSVADVGAATYANGATGTTGVVSSSNSLIGSSVNDQVGYGGVKALTNGNYIVKSWFWDNGTATNAGAATFGDGSTGVTGTISTANSLIGSTSQDSIGVDITALTDGNYLVKSNFWDNGSITNAAAVTLGVGDTGTVGSISSQNSVLGTATLASGSYAADYDATLSQLIVGRANSNIVSIFSYSPQITTGPTASPSTTGVGQEISFSAEASVLIGSLSYSWSFSDGETASGQSVTHSFFSAGTHTATVTVTTLNGQSASSSVNVTILAPKKLEISNLNIKLNFTKSDKDSIVVQGTLPLRKGFKAKGKQITIDIGGISKSATLNSVGSSKRIQLLLNGEKVLSNSRDVRFIGTFTKGNFASSLSDEGLTNDGQKNTKVKVLVTTILGGKSYQRSKSLKYSTKNGKSGEAK